MISLTSFQCPQCLKVFITKIVIRQTISGGRPTLVFPGETCNGIIRGHTEEEDVPCEFNFKALQVESFDIPINAKQLIKKG